MTDRNRGDVVDGFEDRLHGWGSRPPGIMSRAARTRVLARLPEPSRPLVWPRVIAAAALLVVLAVTVWRSSPRPAGEASARPVVAWAPAGSNVVVWVLDARTTVYFVLGPDDPARGGVS